MGDFLYYDGTMANPKPIRTTFNYNYLGKQIRIVGFVLTGFSLLFISASVIWIFVNRNERTVTASQPEFLYLLCFGAAIQAVSLIFISFDESRGWSEQQLDVACEAFPWFFVIGYLVQYCAVFSKVRIKWQQRRRGDHVTLILS